MASRNLWLFLSRIEKFEDVTAPNTINAAILKLIKMQKNFHSRLTAKYPRFLAGYSVQSKMRLKFTSIFERFEPKIDLSNAMKFPVSRFKKDHCFSFDIPKKCTRIILLFIVFVGAFFSVVCIKSFVFVLTPASLFFDSVCCSARWLSFSFFPTVLFIFFFRRKLSHMNQLS